MDINVNWEDKVYTYTGFEVKPLPIVTMMDYPLEIDEHYIVEYKDNIESGLASGVVKSINTSCCYCCAIQPWEETFTFDIEKANMEDVDITCTKIDSEGVCNLGWLELWLGEYKLRYAHDFLYTVENEETPFEVIAHITFVGRGNNFTGEQKKDFRVKKTYVDITEDNFTLWFRPSENDEWRTDIELYYNRLDQRPKVTSDLIEGTDYEVEIPESIKAMDYTITIKGIGNYKGEVTLTYTIHKRNIADCTMNLGDIDPETNGYNPDNFTFYLSRNYTPYPGEDAMYQLIKYEEYVLWYSAYKLDNGNMMAHVTISGKNNHCGEVEFNVEISSMTIFTGRIVTLDEATLYVRHYGWECYERKISGTYYLFDDHVANGRIKITCRMVFAGIVGLVTGWVDVEELDAVKTKEDKKKEIEYFLAGDEIILYKNNVYDKFTDTKPSKVVTGRYYISKNSLFNKRIRICRYKEQVGKQKYITGWVDVADLTVPEEDDF